MDRGDQREVQVNKVLRVHQARGAGMDQWAPVERLDHQVWEKKETEELKARRDVPVLLALLVLWGQKVLQESRVPMEFQVLQVQRVSRVKQEPQERLVIEEHRVYQESKVTQERGEHVEYQVNQDNLDHKALEDQRDLKEVEVKQA
ncbi:hypothetical protein NQZ68_014285 [Dissostichus eleginoides]|nr:hypothetical protein NQZ68_014285 [Dissostichus eleginoides]